MVSRKRVPITAEKFCLALAYVVACTCKCLLVRGVNPNHPKSFKILYMLLYDFGGFRLVECSYHVFT